MRILKKQVKDQKILVNIVLHKITNLPVSIAGQKNLLYFISYKRGKRLRGVSPKFIAKTCDRMIHFEDSCLSFSCTPIFKVDRYRSKSLVLRLNQDNSHGYTTLGNLRIDLALFYPQGADEHRSIHREPLEGLATVFLEFTLIARLIDPKQNRVFPGMSQIADIPSAPLGNEVSSSPSVYSQSSSHESGELSRSRTNNSNSLGLSRSSNQPTSLSRRPHVLEAMNSMSLNTQKPGNSNTFNSLILQYYDQHTPNNQESQFPSPLHRPVDNFLSQSLPPQKIQTLNPPTPSKFMNENLIKQKFNLHSRAPSITDVEMNISSNPLSLSQSEKGGIGGVNICSLSSINNLNEIFQPKQRSKSISHASAYLSAKTPEELELQAKVLQAQQKDDLSFLLKEFVHDIPEYSYSEYSMSPNEKNSPRRLQWLPCSVSAYLIFRSLVHWSGFSSNEAVLSDVVSAISQERKSNPQENDDEFHLYWLATTFDILFLLKDLKLLILPSAPPPVKTFSYKLFHENFMHFRTFVESHVSRLMPPFVSAILEAPSVIGLSHAPPEKGAAGQPVSIKDVINLFSALCIKIRNFFLEMSYADNLLAQLVNLLVAHSFNHLLTHSHLCVFGNGVQAKMTLTQLGEWFLSCQLPLTASALDLLKQTADVLIVQKRELIKAEFRHDLCPLIGLNQLAHLLSICSPDEFDPDPIDPFVISTLKEAGKLEVRKDPFLPTSIDMSESIFSAKILSPAFEKLHHLNLDISLPTSLSLRPGFSFLKSSNEDQEIQYSKW